VAHPGSGLSAAETKNLSGVFVYTEGPALHGNNVSALCPGDSGGPVFRKTTEGMVLVGINSSYTFPPGKAAVPATNWHSRVDVFAKYEIFSWLEKAGTTYAR
jgi:secreted trypsin-like serine protease